MPEPAIMPRMNPDGEAFVERYEMFLKELAVLIHDPFMAFQSFDLMKGNMAHDFQACLRSAVYREVEHIEERLERRYRRTSADSL